MASFHYRKYIAAARINVSFYLYNLSVVPSVAQIYCYIRMTYTVD